MTSAWAEVEVWAGVQGRGAGPGLIGSRRARTNSELVRCLRLAKSQTQKSTSLQTMHQGQNGPPSGAQPQESNWLTFEVLAPGEVERQAGCLTRNPRAQLRMRERRQPGGDNLGRSRLWRGRYCRSRGACHSERRLVLTGPPPGAPQQERARLVGRAAALALATTRNDSGTLNRR